MEEEDVGKVTPIEVIETTAPNFVVKVDSLFDETSVGISATGIERKIEPSKPPEEDFEVDSKSLQQKIRDLRQASLGSFQKAKVENRLWKRIDDLKAELKKQKKTNAQQKVEANTQKKTIAEQKKTIAEQKKTIDEQEKNIDDLKQKLKKKASNPPHLS